MKLKQQASGWPTECDTEEKKRNYLHEYQTHQAKANLANAQIRHKYPAVQNQVNFFRSSQMIDK